MSERRRRLIALAHVAAAQAGCTDEQARRQVQRQVTGVESCRDMDEAALVRLIEHWQRCGARVRLPQRRARPAADRAPLVRKLAAQCHALGRPFPQYTLALLARLGCEVPRIEWAPAPMLRKAVAALAYQQRREAAR